MSTIERAVALLDLFSVGNPELGLSEIRRQTGRDKATCYRHLRALEAVGLIEQNADSKRYRIGPALLRWARVREATVPRRDALRDVLQKLSLATGELAHASILENNRLMALAHCEPRLHPTRVAIDVTEFPLHATASGQAVMAFARPGQLGPAKRKLQRFTQNTVTSPAKLNSCLDQVRESGFSFSDQSFESGVVGTAVPVFDDSGHVAGAVAVAVVAARMEPTLDRSIRLGLMDASRQVTANWGGTIPASLDGIWHRYAAAHPAKRQNAKETA